MILKKYSACVLYIIITLLFIGCQDEMIVRKQDTATIDSLVAQVSKAENQLVSVSLENSEVTIQNVKLANTLDSLMEIREDMAGGMNIPRSIDYTVNVLSVGQTNFDYGRSKGLDNATVIVEQNGLVLQPSSSGAGLYVFNGLSEGTALVRVSAPEHSSAEVTVYMYVANNSDLNTAESFNAASQIFLYPIEGERTATVKGMVYANRSTLNDTLGRTFGSSAAFGEYVNGNISAPGLWNGIDNVTQFEETIARGNIYGTAYGYSVQFEKATEGHAIYAVTTPSLVPNNDPVNSGYITAITHKNLIKRTEVAGDGSYEISVPAMSDYFSYLNITLIIEDMYASHTRLTITNGSYFGESDEAGSQPTNFTYYNNTDAPANIYTGDGVITTGIQPGESLQITRRTVTETWRYEAFIPNSGMNNSVTLERIPGSGETVIKNIYFFPANREL